MLYLIPAAALAAALVRRRRLATGGVFAVSALRPVALSVGAAAAEPAAAGEAAAAAAAAAAASGSGLGQGLGYLAAALATGMSCLGAGIAIASTAPAAIGAFSEDPKAFGKALIFVVLGEGVALYGLLISILLINSL